MSIICNPSITEAERGLQEVQGQHGLESEFQAKWLQRNSVLQKQQMSEERKEREKEEERKQRQEALCGFRAGLSPRTRAP